MGFGSVAPPGRVGFFRNILSLGHLLFKFKGVLSITFIILLVTSIHAISASFEQRTPLPFVKEIGGKLLNHDMQLYLEAEKIKANNGFVITVEEEGGFFNWLKAAWFVLKSIGAALVNLWYLYFFAFLFYKLSILIFTQNSSAKPANIIGTIFLLILFQFAATLLIVDTGGNDEMLSKLTPGMRVLPFKGLYNFVTVIPLLNDPIYDLINDKTESPPAIQEISNVTVNETGQAQ